jgi:DNA (cytosine-5)-methyltransferase 1
VRSIELFAGAGGLGIGVGRSGFKPAAVVEWDQYCCDTIRENKEGGVEAVLGWPVFQGDVRDFDFSEFEDKIHLVSGGPPCQPFSLGGKHRGQKDNRDMFPEAVRAVRETRPLAFIFENVKGLTRASFANYFEYIRLQLEFPEIVRRPEETWSDHLGRLERHYSRGTYWGLHYNVVFRVLNAANFGVPQRRERVFLVGFRSDLEIEWKFPEESHSCEALLWSQSCGDYWDQHRVPRAEQKSTTRRPRFEFHPDLKPYSKPWVTVRDALAGLPDPEYSSVHAKKFLNHRFQQGTKSYPGHTGSPLDEPAKTLKAGVHGVPGGENMLRRPNGSIRYFSARESARLQTFPDEYKFQGSWSESMRQLGNAVPVELAEILASDIGKHLARRGKMGSN